MAEPKYERGKFKELLVYVAQRTQGDLKCGDMKLNKLLYFADVTAYRRRGRPITGARYQHQPHGPTAKPLVPARRELVRSGRLDTKKRDYHGREQLSTEALDDPDTSLFEKDELAIIDEVLDKFKDLDGTELEQVAHQEPGWQMTSDGEVIPYRSTLLARTASPRAVARGNELAKFLGW